MSDFSTNFCWRFYFGNFTTVVSAEDTREMLSDMESHFSDGQQLVSFTSQTLKAIRIQTWIELMLPQNMEQQKLITRFFTTSFTAVVSVLFYWTVLRLTALLK